MNIKRSLPMTILLLAFSISCLRAQSIDRNVVSTQGETFNKAEVGSVEWTIGEVVTENTDDCFLTQGFHQSFLISGCGFSAAEDVPINPELMLFPNPTRDKINIIAQEENIKKIYVFDWQGKLLLQLTGNQSNQSIVNVADLPAAQYIIRVQTSQSILNQSFIKID